MNKRQRLKLSPMPHKLALILLLLFGFVAMLLTEIVFGSRVVHANAQKRMEDVCTYIEKQCLLYDDVTSEEKTKSLIRIADKTLLLQQQFSHNAFQDRDALLNYMEQQRLTAIVISDDDAGTTQMFSPERISMKHWQEVIRMASSVLDNPGKVFSDRFYDDDGYCYDYAVVARHDRKGVILCYLRQESAAVAGTELSVRTLLSGYSFVKNGVVIVTNGVSVIGSNREELNGLRRENTRLLVAVKRAERGEHDLSEVRVDGESYLVLSDRSKNYCVYLFYPMAEIYKSYSVLLSCSAILYGVLSGAVLLVWFRFENRRRIAEIQSAEQYHEELDRLANDAIHANEAKTDFLRRMSHDIRTPVNGIRGMLDMAEYYDSDKEKRRDCYNKMREASGYLLDLVTDVLDMSKLEQGEVIWKDENFRLDRVFDEICTMMKQQAKEKGVAFEDFTEEIPYPYLIGSEVSFKRICLNLIGNALKYNRPGGTVRVSCREESCDGEKAVIEFICSDTGIGMSPDFMRHMYEPFAQEDRSIKSSYSGTGLGLAIVKKLVDRLDGKIEVDSRQGVGSRFRVTMTFRIDPDEKEKPSENLMQTLHEDGNRQLDGAKILIAEDNDLNMEIAQFILERSGATVIRAYDGKEAVERFMNSEAGEIDLILMDLMMPVIDGILATQMIRASGHPDAKTVPIIAMTANAYPDDIERSMQSGMNGHLAKPLDAHRLVDVAATYYEKRKAEKRDDSEGIL